jgi:hypothetical protein
MKKIYLLILLFSSLAFHSSAQTITQRTITSAGQLSSNRGIVVNFTVGELVIENFKNADVGLNTGLFGKRNYETVPLPVTLKEFRLVSQDTKVKLYWTVAQQKNASVYEIQKSTDGVSFSSIGKVNAFGNTLHNVNYDFPDDQFFKKSYYRLKMIEADGKYVFSNILTATPITNINKISVFPNPTKSFVNVNIGSRARDIAHIYIRNAAGSAIIAKSYILSAGNNSLSINVNSLPAGTYFITIATQDNKLNQSLLKF